jgi:prepilin-type N-terminal cleavage/methylation domain-containing protein
MKKKKAFTLLEIMVVIALIWIIALWATKLNFKLLSDRQRLDWFFYDIKTKIETIQNNALIWKAIKDWTNLVVPNKWQIDFNNSWSGIIVSQYYIWNTKKEFNRIIPKAFYYIETSNNLSKLSDTWSLLIEGSNMTLTWVSSKDKVLEIKIWYKNFSKTLKLNTISWVIEETNLTTN